MRVALVHYHLQSGGVTRIVSHQQQVLRDLGIASITLAGKPPFRPLPGPFRVVPGLLYEGERPATSPLELAQAMTDAATEALGGTPDLWHVHNHSLGKNLVLPGALLALARQGARLLFQLHDFAEDGRPGNYRAMLAKMVSGNRQDLFRQLYPQAAHLHYAVLNRRDALYLGAAGLSASHLHHLPNPVDLGEVAPVPEAARPEGPPLWLYPTRAIRRKNIGELLLWAALSPAGTRFATTGGPENPIELPRYQRWKQVAAELGLPVHFEITGPPGPSFPETLKMASAAITTSVAEGFGMAFLEPWLLGIPVCGRNLTEVTSEFQREGIVLPWSYDRLDVPLDWLGRERVVAAAREGLARCLDAYGRSPAQDALERVLAAWIEGDGVDFGRLGEPLQEAILRRLHQSGGAAELFRPGALPDPAQLRHPLTSNQAILRSRYTLAGYGQALTRVYAQVAASPLTPIDRLDGEILLDRFLAPERLSLLRAD